MNQLLKQLYADLHEVEQQKQTAEHAGDHVDAQDYENIALGIKRSIAKVEAIGLDFANLIQAGDRMAERVNDGGVSVNENRAWSNARQRLCSP